MSQQRATQLPPVETLTESALHGEIAQDLLSVLGLPATLQLVEAFGGLALRIPLGITTQGQARRDAFVQLLGLDATTRLIAHYGGTMLYVPCCRQARVDARDEAINRKRNTLAQAGHSERRLVNELAQEYGLTSRHIWRILKKPLPPTATPDASRSTRVPAAHGWR